MLAHLKKVKFFNVWIFQNVKFFNFYDWLTVKLGTDKGGVGRQAMLGWWASGGKQTEKDWIEAARRNKEHWKSNQVKKLWCEIYASVFSAHSHIQLKGLWRHSSLLSTNVTIKYHQTMQKSSCSASQLRVQVIRKKVCFRQLQSAGSPEVCSVQCAVCSVQCAVCSV